MLAGRTAAAETLAAHALALTPDDRLAQEAWANASDQLAVARDGWRTVSTASEVRHEQREGAVLSLLAQSLPHTSGGYATRSHGVLTGLAARGWDVAAVTRPGFPYDRWQRDDARQVADVDEVDGIRYHHLLDVRRRYPQYPLTTYVDGYARAAEVRARRHGAALVHASSFHVNGLAGQAAAARLGVPFVYEMRGLEELMKVSRDPSFATSERHAFLEHLETTICHAADRVLVITEALRDLVVDRGVDADKVLVLPNGVHADQFRPRARDEDLAARLGVTGKTVIGYAGGLVDYEGLELLLQATAALRTGRPGPADFHVVVVGDGHVEAQLHGLAAALGLHDVVTFVGRVPHEEVPAYLSLFDVAPFPRLPLPVCEAISPIKPFESMAMGKAVVVSSVAALTEIVTDGSTGLVFEKGSSADLARVLGVLLDAPDLRARLGETARDWVRRERDWSSVVAVVDDVYRELTGQGAIRVRTARTVGV
ncbi:glycosyltransferase [Nocardioides guangzhouensis]|uniref:Glycosyltransferase n=1 Tax=Nocardioides guangzhouensis TaxID=2497878 RepID=A0A4Q4ZJX2_9ACTN|nr:glycosyltransferase [Nocardioides guangzhouensis]